MPAGLRSGRGQGGHGHRAGKSMTPQLAVEPGAPLGQRIVLGIGEWHPTMTVLRPELRQLLEPLVEFLVLALRHVQPVDLGVLSLAQVQLELDGLELPDPLVGEG